MPIKFVDSAEITVENVVAVVYGKPGEGKTTLSLTAESPALIDFDHGVYRAANRAGTSAISVSAWKDVENIRPADLQGYKTVIVDTVGTTLDCLAVDILSGASSMSRGGGQLSLQGFGALKARFMAWVKMLRAAGVDVILIAHSTERGADDAVTERLQAVGTSKDYVMQCADIIGRVYHDGGKRMISFSPSESAIGKGPGLPDYEIPDVADADDTMARILADTKERINGASTDGVWRQRVIGEIKGKSGVPLKLAIDALHGERALSDWPAPLKRELHHSATEGGLQFDKEAGEYVVAQAAEEAML